MSTLETWVRRLVGRSSAADPSARRSTGAGAAAATAAEPRLVGERVEVRRLLVVRPETVAVLLPSGGEPQLRSAGDLLVPPLLAPGAPRVSARALSTAPVDLDVTVTDLVTFDGHQVDRAALRLTLELAEDDGYGPLLELVASHPDDPEEQLLAAVHREVTAAVRGAFRMNRLADLQRLTLAVVLEGRWLPARFGAGTLRCRHLRVQRVRWPDEDEATVPVRVDAPVTPTPDPALPRSAA
ncbi:hypothetical protein [uncultured Friedmanniella sp.]|uniref:hypothetical protein n=1 Tax=uncultured Friedmanniella sp. TaxID=335381 RepID=UPI0035C9724D